jgi:hypothetical protein
MILLIHIIFALISVVFVSYTAINPSTTKLRFSYFLTFSTLLSGFVVLFTNPVNLGRVCLGGSIYLGLVVIILTVARKRLSNKLMAS